MDIAGKRVTVVGLARSGVAAARLLSAEGAKVTVTDSKTAEELCERVRDLPEGVRLELGGHPERVFLDADLIVLSPGVPTGIGPVAAAGARGIPVVGELELAFRMAEDLFRGVRDRVPLIAVTGSNGKSTTTSLLDFTLRMGGLRTVLGGNIGAALTEELGKAFPGGSRDGAMMPDWIVAEVSSFQLETIVRFRPCVAAILNITPDHLDRYHSMEEYGSAKRMISANQRSDDVLVLNADDPLTRSFGEDLSSPVSPADRPRILFFSRRKRVSGLYAEDGAIFANLPAPAASFGPVPILRVDELAIRGVHNLENAMAAALMALAAGCPLEAVQRALTEFRGLEHRLEDVRTLDGVRYINDSKGTNVDAVVKSVESFSGPVILIAGGRDKAGDFLKLRPFVAGKVKALVLIGEAAPRIREALGDLTETVLAKSLGEAVALSRERAAAGDVVLLSPACASFDMFRDFEDRGRQFKAIVRELGGTE